MAGKVHRVVQDAGNDHDIAGCQPIDQDVPRRLDDPCRFPGSLPAILQMVDAPTSAEIVAFHRSRAPSVVSNIPERGGNEHLMTLAGCRPQSAFTPIEQSSDVAFGGFRQPETCHSLRLGAPLPGNSKTSEELRQLVHIKIAILATRQGVFTLPDCLSEAPQFQHVLLMSLLQET